MTPRFNFVSLALALSLGVLPSTACAQQSEAPTSAQAPAPPTAPQRSQLSAPDGRVIHVATWVAANERAVVVFSHGHGGRPTSYNRLVSAWVADGFTVVAPLHVDSMAHPDRASFDGPAGFSARLTDLAVVRAYVKATHPGRPLIAAGHSYGSLMSMIQAGAVTPAGPMADPDIDAVIGLSSAGDLPGLITPQSYAAVTTPTLIISGDRDLVPDYVTDWRAHRSPFDRSPPGAEPGDKMLVVYEGGDHSLVGNADAEDFALMVALTTDFMEAHALDDRAADARLDSLVAPAGVTIERR